MIVALYCRQCKGKAFDVAALAFVAYFILRTSAVAQDIWYNQRQWLGNTDSVYSTQFIQKRSIITICKVRTCVLHVYSYVVRLGVSG